jgi:mannose/fructose-specific phosphotransferase system component IIA
MDFARIVGNPIARNAALSLQMTPRAARIVGLNLPLTARRATKRFQMTQQFAPIVVRSWKNHYRQLIQRQNLSTSS